MKYLDKRFSSPANSAAYRDNWDAVFADACQHCGDAIDEKTRSHWAEGDGTGYGHSGLCCDCMDLSCGMPLDQLNDERASKGKAPIEKPWPTGD